MRIVIIYESMFGNTHAIAEAIAEELQQGNEIAVIPAARASRDLVAGADLIVVGGPTHMHGMSRANSRSSAVKIANKPGSGLVLDADATGLGLRDWFVALGELSSYAAAFDTRLNGLAAFTGRASKGIRRELARHGCKVIAGPESFLVTGKNQLQPGEVDHAREWGRRLASKMATVRAAAPSRSAGRAG